MNAITAFLTQNDLRVEKKFNLSGYFEYHILNYANQTIAKNTVLQFAIDSAVQLYK
ncbi:hypothetical protein [Acinetobacter sp. TR11]|uniref:hypothetical protein n=1 Tax=Acinetobacter sp. TR11 TaxID=3003393 RepID=UPI0022AC1AAF|nr:hypothetical protein [Acinetobacter sp. TR11]WAU72875.1 hypothetical protein O1450_12385 [Acinetobacter sp. TR11]